MRMLVVLALIGAAAAGRLENTYLPPQGAALAGGQDLPLPSNNYLPAHTEAVQKSFTATPGNNYLPPTRTAFPAPVNTYQAPAVSTHRQSAPGNTYLPPGNSYLPPGNSYLPPQQESNSLVVEAPARRQQITETQQQAFHFSHSSSPSASKSSAPFGFSQQSSSLSAYSAPSITKTTTTYTQQPASFVSKASSYDFSHKSSSSGFSGFSQQASPIATKSSVSSAAPQGSYNYPQPSNSFASEASTRQGFNSAPVAIIRSVNDNNGDGVYTYSYETENGIQAEERGQLRQDGAEGIQSVQGAFSYTGPDSVRYTVTYTADENGFQASGDHLPTPPPIPEAILRSLELNAREEAEALRSAQQQQHGYQYQQPQLVANRDSGYQYQQPQQAVSRDSGYQYNQPRQQPQQPQQVVSRDGGYHY